VKPVDNKDIVHVTDKNELGLVLIERYKSKTATL
jgi:hypothetical protein